MRGVCSRGAGLARVGQRRSGLASVRLKGSLGRRRSFEMFGVSRLEMCFDDFRGAGAALNRAVSGSAGSGLASVRLKGSLGRRRSFEMFGVSRPDVLR